MSDIRFLMRHLEKAANEIGRTCNSLTLQEEASILFEEIKDSVYQYDKESERSEQYKWATWVRKLRRRRSRNERRTRNTRTNGDKDENENEFASV